MITSLSRNATVLRKQVVKIIGKTIGAIAHLIYGYIDNVAKELLVSTCQTTEYLQIHAKENNVPRKAPTYARGTIQFTGLEGSIILEQTECTGDNGVQYRVVSSVEIGIALTAICTVVAVESGAKGNLSAGSSIVIDSEIPGVNSTGTVQAGGITGGVDIEAENSWKSRILRKKQRISMGGKDEDWEDWMRDCPSLTPTRVWASPGAAGLNSVVCMFVFDDRENVAPTSTDIATMDAWLNAQRPITQHPNIVAPTLRYVGFTILLNPLTTPLQQAINNALANLFILKAEAGGTLLLSDIRETVAYASGSADDEVVAIWVDGNPGAMDDVTVGAGELAVFDENDMHYGLRS
jgi:uncharacterized phage protein gp47/JayE